MNLPTSEFLQLVEPLPTTVSSPKLDLIALTWDHIANRYLQRIEPNRVLAGRVRSIRLLAVHDAIQSVIDPGNGHIFKEISRGSTIEASFAATIQASHDILAAVFDSAQDRADLADLLAESLALIGKDDEKSAGTLTGASSAAAYLRTFSPLLQNHRVTPPAARFRESLATVGSRSHRSWPVEWQRSA
jgi:hypothetical protein